MSVQAISFLLAAIISASLAIALVIRGARYRLYASFSTLNAVFFLYYVSAFVYHVSDEGFWFRVSILAALAIPTSSIRFFTIFLGQSGAHQVSRATLTVSIVLAPVALSQLVHQPIVRALVVLYVFSSLVFCMVMIFERLHGTTSRVESARLKYLLFGGSGAIIFTLLGYIPTLQGPWFPAFGYIVAVIYMYFLSQIIIQFRLLDLNELVAKIIVLAALVTVLAAVYSLIGLFELNTAALVFFNTVIAGFVIMILFEPVSRLVEDRVNRLLFRERYEFGRQLALLRRELANVISVDRMCQLILTRLENSRRVTGASIYLIEEHTTKLRCTGQIGPPPTATIDAVSERPFLERLAAAKALIVEPIEAELRELFASGDVSERDALNETLRVLGVLDSDVCIGMFSEDRVVGLLCLRDDRMRDSYSPEEIAHLIAIANQATICVENSAIVTTMRDRDRLAAVGEMAAGLAHEVRNPLGAIKGAAQMLTDDEGDEEVNLPPGSDEFIEIIIEEVNRLDKVVSAFLDYAKPYDRTAGPTAVNEVIEKVVRLVRGPASEADVEIETKLDASVPAASIDPETFRQVLWNLALNAIEASEPGVAGVLTVSTRLGNRMSPLHGGYFTKEIVEVEVADTGPGIPESDLDRVFIPFYTTKSSGTGLGLAICNRLIRGAGGTISAASKVGEGTTITVRLPLWSDEMGGSAENRPAKS